MGTIKQSIWKQGVVDVHSLNLHSANTMAEFLSIRFTEVGDDYLKATMPVNERTRQPRGLLHGGASAAMVETVGSVASYLCIDPERQTCVGMAINCNHISSVKHGDVLATAVPVHLGAKTHVWDIKLSSENGKLVCVGRLTVAVLNK